MRTSKTISRTVVAALTAIISLSISSWVVIPVSFAQEDNNKICSVKSVYTEGYLVFAGGIQDCDIVHKIQSAVDEFFDAQCNLAKARTFAADPRTYDAANSLVKTASAEIRHAGASFQEAAKEVDTGIKLPAGKETAAAGDILKVYGYSIPETYSEAFQSLSDAMIRSADGLSMVRFSQDADDSLLHDNMFSLTGAMMRPGGVYLAVSALFRQAVS